MMLINQKRIVLIFCLLFTSFVGQSTANLMTVIQIQPISGGYAIIQAQPGSKVLFRERNYAVDEQGFVAIPFGREVAGLHEITLVDRDRTERTEAIWIDTRSYVIQRVNGVDQSRVTPPVSVTDRITAEAVKVNRARSAMSSLQFWREQQFIRPAPGPVSGVYGSQRFYNGIAGSPHWGIDYAAPTGTKVIAPAGGKVVLAEADLYFSGGTIVLDHGGGLTSSFLHLSRLLVKPGDIVEQGAVIGLVGATGRVTGPHLDWRMNLHGERIDAALWLQAQ